jgi:SAM-dependent methyltransferase
MSAFDVFAKHYDLEFGGFLDDLPVYAGYAERTGGPLLELGCGTGRLLLPLAEAGYAITGVDLSPAMLARAERRLAAAGCRERVTLVEDDMRSLERLGATRFRLALCAINSFLHLPDGAAQQAALAAVRRRLEPGGLLILDVFHPHPDLLTEYDGRLIHEATFVDEGGARVDKFASRTLDAATQTVHTVFFYERLGPDGLVRRTAAPFAMRYLHRSELELRLTAAGYELLDLFGGYDLAPFDSDSLHMIAVARPRDEWAVSSGQWAVSSKWA